MEKLLTPENVCEVLGIERSTLYAWTSRGLIPFFKVNGLLRFRESEILKWLKSKERGTIMEGLTDALERSREKRRHG
jgi:excisionase family DNA binding protein